MFTTGFKYWFGAAAFALLAAFAYAVSTSDAGLMDTIVGPLSVGYKGAVGEHAGYAALLGFAGVFLATALLLVAWRDADPQSVAEVARTDEPPQPHRPQGPSRWPALGAFGAALVAMGVVIDAAVTLIGFGLLLVVALEWTIRTWSERATVSAETNRELRTKLFFPVELPVVSAVVIAVFVLAGSRILLAVDKTSSVVVAGVLATVVFLGAIAIAARPALSRGLINTVLVVGALGLLAGGIVAAAAGEREFHPHDAEHGEEHVDDGADHGDEGEHEDDGTSEGEDGAEADHADEALGVAP